MQYLTIEDALPATGARPDLVLVPRTDAADLAATAAQARVRHALVRSVQEFLDRAGFVELDRAPEAALAARLGRTCWATREGIVAGLLDGADGADGAAVLDVLERALLAGLHGTLNRAYNELQSLGVDLDRLKYLRLPVRRIRQEDAAQRWLLNSDQLVLAAAGEPILLVQYAPPDPLAELLQARLREARLLLPGTGCVAAASAGGRFSLDLPALVRFVCRAEVAVLARPADG